MVRSPAAGSPFGEVGALGATHSVRGHVGAGLAMLDVLADSAAGDELRGALRAG
jgi:hypothetical protein